MRLRGGAAAAADNLEVADADDRALAELGRRLPLGLSGMTFPQRVTFSRLMVVHIPT